MNATTTPTLNLEAIEAEARKTIAEIQERQAKLNELATAKATIEAPFEPGQMIETSSGKRFSVVGVRASYSLIGGGLRWHIAAKAVLKSGGLGVHIKQVFRADSPRLVQP